MTGVDLCGLCDSWFGDDPHWHSEDMWVCADCCDAITCTPSTPTGSTSTLAASRGSGGWSSTSGGLSPDGAGRTGNPPVGAEPYNKTTAAPAATGRRS